MQNTTADKREVYLSLSFLRKLDKAEPYVRELIISLAEEIQSKIIVSRTDFDDLKNIVKELGEAQKRTELRVEELAEAQKRTELRMEELAEAQKKIELRMESLVKAQNKIEAEVRDVKKQLGGLTADVGYGIEDKIMPYIRDFGKKEFEADIRLVERKNLVYPDGKYDEINIYAEGLKKGKPVFLIGECKAQPGKKDFDRFAKIAERVKKILSGDIYAFIVGYSFSPEIEVYAKEKYPHIRTYKTYQFEMKYEKIRLTSLNQD